LALTCHLECTNPNPIVPIDLCRKTLALTCHLECTNPCDSSTHHDCSHSLRHAFQCIARPNKTCSDKLLYLAYYLYDPGILPGSADQCILWSMLLMSNLLRLPCGSEVLCVCVCCPTSSLRIGSQEVRFSAGLCRFLA